MFAAPGFVFVAGQSLARFDGRGVAREVVDHTLFLSAAYQRFMHLGGQFGTGKLGKSAREGGLGGHLRGSVPAAQAAQWCIALQALNQMPGGGQVVDGFGEECSGQTEAVGGTATIVEATIFHEPRERLQADDSGQQLALFAEWPEG